MHFMRDSQGMWKSTWQISTIFLYFITFVSGQKSGEQALNLEETCTQLKDDNDLTPQSICMKLKLGSGTVNLNLEKNPQVGKFAPVIIANNGNLKPWSNQRSEDFAVYQDKKNQASILAFSGRNSDGSTVREYQGTFRYNKENYGFESNTGAFRRRKRSTNSGGYVVYKAPTVTDEFGPQRQSNVSIINYGQMLDYIGSVAERKPQYIVEVLIVADYAVYKKWYDISEKTTDMDKQNDAINSIRYYYSQIVNGMDLRYSSINAAGFTINVKLAGFYVATTPNDSPWTELGGRKQTFDGGYVYSEAYAALDNFDTWCSQHQNDLPSFDQASLITGLRLMAGTPKPGADPFSISGLANIRAICSKGRVSISKEAGEYATTQTCSHELGHNLGALHDGEGNTCSKTDQYIMSPVPSVLNDQNFDHPYHFSACSVSYMQDYLGALTLMETNCLLTTSRLDEGDVEKNGKIPVGQFVNLDKQCQLLYGVDSYYCGGSLFDAQICNQLYCYNAHPDYKRCVSKVEQRAADGTSCGNRKWCDMGRCVDNPAAPDTPASCISGDRKGVVDNDGKTCSQKIKADPSFCYQDYWRETCCATCQDVRNQNTDDCQYGDGDPKYCTNLTPSNCYDIQIQQLCCVSCKKYKTNLANCQYGDRALWCGTTDDTSICYSSSSSCCSYCLLSKSGYSNCMYGDKAAWCKTLNTTLCKDGNNADICCQRCSSTMTTPTPGFHPTVPPSDLLPIPTDCIDSASWCSSMSPNSCYTTKQICCKTCYYLNNGDTGCEYGNRFDWCTTLPLEKCQYVENQEDCCERCAVTRRKVREEKLAKLTSAGQKKHFSTTLVLTVMIFVLASIFAR